VAPVAGMGRVNVSDEGLAGMHSEGDSARGAEGGGGGATYLPTYLFFEIF
jgi:hypothetical protein